MSSVQYSIIKCSHYACTLDFHNFNFIPFDWRLLISPTLPAPGNQNSPTLPVLALSAATCFWFLPFFYVISYTICLFSVLFNVAWCPLGSHILSQKAGFSSFLWLNDIPLYIPIYFLPSLYNTSYPFICWCILGFFHITMEIFPIPVNRKTEIKRQGLQDSQEDWGQHSGIFKKCKDPTTGKGYRWAWTWNLPITWFWLEICNKISICLYFLSSEQLKQSNWDRILQTRQVPCM